MYFDSYATGKRIQQLRKANGMTQEQFAIELNTSDRHIRRIERGFLPLALFYGYGGR